MKFFVYFWINKGNAQQVSTKKIVRLIDLHQVQQSNRTIFCLPDSPDFVAFEEDILNSTLLIAMMMGELS